MTATIVVFEPPTQLVWTSPDAQHPHSVVTWRLEPDEPGTRLTLTLDGLPSSVLPDVSAGWHTHLEAMPGAIEGLRTPWSADREREIAALYAGQPPG